MTRLGQVDRVAYQRARQRLQRILVERQDYYRFCHKLNTLVKELEADWQIAIEATALSIEPGNIS